VAGTVQASVSRSRPTACRSAGAAASHRWRGVCPVSECTWWWQALCTQWSSSWLTSSRLVTWWRAGSPSPVTSTRNWRRIVSNILSTLPLPGAWARCE